MFIFKTLFLQNSNNRYHCHIHHFYVHHRHYYLNHHNYHHSHHFINITFTIIIKTTINITITIITSYFFTAFNFVLAITSISIITNIRVNTNITMNITIIITIPTKLLTTTLLPALYWLTHMHKFIQQSLNSSSAQVQILLTACHICDFENHWQWSWVKILAF